MPYAAYMPPVGGNRASHPEITDQCRPQGEKTHSEHSYPPYGPACCRRCGAIER
jgi:hypothetical protein